MVINLRPLVLGGTLALSTITGALADDAAEWREDIDAFVAVLTAEHQDPYFTTSREDFDVYVIAFEAGLEDMTETERVLGLARLAGMVGDGHTWMPLHAIPFDGLPPGPGFRSLPLRFELFEEGIFIVGATDGYSSLLGARVVSFGDVSAADAIDRALTLLPQDAVNFSRELVPEWLMLAEVLEGLDLASSADTIALSVERSGDTYREEIAPLDASVHYNWVSSIDGGPAGEDSPLPWQTASPTPPMWMIPIDGNWRLEQRGNHQYVQLAEIRNAGDDSLADMAERAVDAALAAPGTGLIIDLRRTIGGNGNLNDGFVSALERFEAAAGDGHLAVLTSRQTHSAAIMLVSALEQRTSAHFFGQPTADRPNHHGETNIFVTPNRHLPVLHASEFYTTSTEGDMRPYLTPDVLVPYRFADYITRRDPVLEAAQTFLDGEQK